jgi:uncharacterized delta-60 repeat protein
VSTDFALLRYNTDGTVDSSFDGDGKLTTEIGTESFVRSLALQADGKLLAAGYGSNGITVGISIARYEADGSLDNSFGTDGIVVTTIGSSTSAAYSILVQPDGKILATGYSVIITDNTSELVLARYNADGTPDSTFGNDGIVTNDFGYDLAFGTGAVLLPDGRILLVGTASYGNQPTNYLLVQFLPDGSLDNSFGNNGIIITNISPAYDSPHSLKLLADGRFVVAGTTGYYQDNQIALARYNKNGLLDSSFSDDGMLIISISTVNDEANDMLLQPDGKIVIAGTTWDLNAYKFMLMRLNENGTPDSSFGANGITTTDVVAGSSIHSVASQPDGKIVAAGLTYYAGDNTEIALARYIGDFGTEVIDTMNNGNSLIVFPNPFSNSATIQFSISKNSAVEISLFDLGGRKIKTITAGNFEAGNHLLLLEKESLVAGVYLLQLHLFNSPGKGESQTITQKLIIEQ